MISSLNHRAIADDGDEQAGGSSGFARQKLKKMKQKATLARTLGGNELPGKYQETVY